MEPLATVIEVQGRTLRQIAKIPLTKGKVAIVDADDYDWLIEWRWSAHKSRGRWDGAHRNARCSELAGKRSKVSMARQILNAPNGVEVDHINGDVFDNRRANLRLATHSENARNRTAAKNNASGFKGVRWLPKIQKWQARISANKKEYHLGCFDSPEEASAAYDAAATEMHGSFAKLNLQPKVQLKRYSTSPQNRVAIAS
jgi:HNH endonuclease/AP2 domain-containing protein